MIKVITGAPRSGKTYYAVREVVVKNLNWNNEVHEWELKRPEDKFTIITNIDGLRLPHLKLDAYLQLHQISIEQFCTVHWLETRLIPDFGRVVLIIDEAQKYFPSDFKDPVKGNPSQSVFHFFEYHGHFPIDIYLIGQLWTRFHPNIVRLAEYQIEAVRRTMSVMGEFRYHFMNGHDIIHREVLKSDPRIFSLYQSNYGEMHVNKKIQPMRKWLYFFIFMLILCLASGYFVYTRFVKLVKGDGDPEARAGAAVEGRKPSSLPASETVQLRKIEQPISKPTFIPGGVAPPVVQAQKFAQIRLGGAWVENDLIAIDLHGQIIPVSEFPYSFSVTGQGRFRAVLAQVPVDVLGAIRPTIWLDGQGVASDARQSEGESKSIQPPPPIPQG